MTYLQQLSLEGLFYGDYDRISPKWLIKKVEKIFGQKIGLDPCTNSDNPTNAQLFIPFEDDSLSYDWSEFNYIYLNPPKENNLVFLQKFVDALDICNKLETGIVVLHYHSKQVKAIARLITASTLICYPQKAIWEEKNFSDLIVFFDTNMNNYWREKRRHLFHLEFNQVGVIANKMTSQNKLKGIV